MRYTLLTTDALCPMPTEAYALCPREHLMLLRKAISNFINSNPDPRELKRAMSVMMWIEGIPCSQIQKILNVSATFVSQVKMKFI